MYKSNDPQLGVRVRTPQRMTYDFYNKNKKMTEERTYVEEGRRSLEFDWFCLERDVM